MIPLRRNHSVSMNTGTIRSPTGGDAGNAACSAWHGPADDVIGFCLQPRDANRLAPGG
jgi:hypothetical protein